MFGSSFTPVLFTITFLPFTLIVGHLLRTQGRVFLEHVFAGEASAVSATNFLLNIGFYLLCTGLLFLNLGIPSTASSAIETVEEVAIRLGVCVMLVAGLHSLNVLGLVTLLRRKSANR